MKESARFTQLLQKHSIAMNYTEGSSWEKVLGGFMDLTGVPVGFTAEGLRFILDNLQAGSAVLGVGAGGAFVGAGHKLYKGLKANPLGKKRQEELANLQVNLELDINRLKGLYQVMDESATLPQFTDKRSGATLDSKAELRKQIENSHPSSKLLKAMSKFEAKMARSESLNSGPSQRQVELVSILNKAIDDELKRLEKLQHTDVGQKNWSF